LGTSCLILLFLSFSGTVRISFPSFRRIRSAGDKNPSHSYLVDHASRHLHHEGRNGFKNGQSPRLEPKLGHDYAKQDARFRKDLMAGIMKHHGKERSPRQQRDSHHALGNDTKEKWVLPPFNLTFIGNTTTHIVCSNGQAGILNDNYCDCPNGSDEYTTSACSHLLVSKAVFRCGEGSNTTIFASRVGDGIIDCPDGSDEYRLSRGASILPAALTVK
jgi:hypothetical protein